MRYRILILMLAIMACSCQSGDLAAPITVKLGTARSAVISPTDPAPCLLIDLSDGNYDEATCYRHADDLGVADVFYFGNLTGGVPDQISELNVPAASLVTHAYPQKVNWRPVRNSTGFTGGVLLWLASETYEQARLAVRLGAVGDWPSDVVYRDAIGNAATLHDVADAELSAPDGAFAFLIDPAYAFGDPPPQ